MGSKSEKDDDVEDEGDVCVPPLGEKHNWTSGKEAKRRAGRGRQERRGCDQQSRLCAVNGTTLALV